jgi:orotate phosphoribosyltransferase
VDSNRQTLRDMIEERCLEVGEFTLTTGQKSSYYFDCKKATLDGPTLALIADAFLEEIRQLPTEPQAIGGLTMGADFIAAAVAMRATQVQGRTVHASIVRKEPKKHGTRNYIENQLPAGTDIVVVDDVVTSGKSTHLACEKLLEAGYRITGIVALVDREAGGMEALARAFDCPVRAVLKKAQFPRLMALQRAQDARTAG